MKRVYRIASDPMSDDPRDFGGAEDQRTTRVRASGPYEALRAFAGTDGGKGVHTGRRIVSLEEEAHPYGEKEILLGVAVGGGWPGMSRQIDPRHPDKVAIILENLKTLSIVSSTSRIVEVSDGDGPPERMLMVGRPGRMQRGVFLGRIEDDEDLDAQLAQARDEYDRAVAIGEWLVGKYRMLVQG